MICYHILSQLNPMYTLSFYICNTHFNTILLSGLFHTDLETNIIYLFLTVPSMLHVLPISSTMT